jgi:hypothetical protein
MKKTLIVIVLIVVINSIFAVYMYWLHNQPKPEAGQEQVVLPSTQPAQPKLEVRQVIEAPPAQTPLPMLSESDSFMFNALSKLITNKSLMKLFYTEGIIHNITATIDNLTYRRAPMRVMPIESAPGKFQIAGSESDLTISPKNSAHYTLYVKIAEAIDAKELVELYVRLYPLFQQSYEELGYPKKYFNDRLLTVLDNLLAAPVPDEPVKLVHPNLFYQYADPDLEGRSIGQRILMRLGRDNEVIIKNKLHAINQELLLHMHEK